MAVQILRWLAKRRTNLPHFNRSTHKFCKAIFSVFQKISLQTLQLHWLRCFFKIVFLACIKIFFIHGILTPLFDYQIASFFFTIISVHLYLCHIVYRGWDVFWHVMTQRRESYWVSDMVMDVIQVMDMNTSQVVEGRFFSFVFLTSLKITAGHRAMMSCQIPNLTG